MNAVLSSYFDGLQSTPSAAPTLRRYIKAVDDYAETLSKKEYTQNAEKIRALNSKVESICSALAEDRLDDNSLFFAAVHYDKLGKMDLAHDLYEKAKCLKPRANTYLMYADSYLDSDPSEAQRLYEEGISKDEKSKRKTHTHTLLFGPFFLMTVCTLCDFVCM